MERRNLTQKFMLLALLWVGLVGLALCMVMVQRLPGSQPAAPRQAGLKAGVYGPRAYLPLVGQGMPAGPAASGGVRAAFHTGGSNPLGLPALRPQAGIWERLAINQISPQVTQAASQAFVEYGFLQADPRLMCAEAATTMAMNYLNTLQRRPLVAVGDTIELVASNGWFSTPDGLLDSQGRINIARQYGFKTFSHSEERHGRPDEYLSREEIQQFAQSGYPVLLSMRYQTLPDASVEISTNPNMEFNHSVLLVGYDAGQDEYLIVSPLVSYNDGDDASIRPQAVPAETFLASWEFEEGVGIGTVVYR